MHLHRVAFQSLFTFCYILTLVAHMQFVAMCLSFVPFIILKTACNVITLITRVSVIIVISLLMQFQRTIQRECFVAQITGILYPLMLYFLMNSQSMGNCSFVFALITTELLVSMNPFSVRPQTSLIQALKITFWAGITQTYTGVYIFQRKKQSFSRTNLNRKSKIFII